ncbi:class I SAM-dependent methyltransferase [Actinomycetota bacterium]
MNRTQASTYGETFADIYDDLYPTSTQVDLAVTAIRELAGEGPVLELGVGTGRVALPLATAGAAVTGVDASAAMLERLSAKDPDGTVRLLEGVITEPHGDGLYGVATLLAQTLFLLPSATDQARCLGSAAQAVRPGGYVVVETYARVPEQHAAAGLTLTPAHVVDDLVLLMAADHDPDLQTILVQHVLITGGGTHLLPVHLRYLTLPQMDLMADQSGLSLVHRWSDWNRHPMEPTSPMQISVYQRTASAKDPS